MKTRKPVTVQTNNGRFSVELTEGELKNPKSRFHELLQSAVKPYISTVCAISCFMRFYENKHHFAKINTK